MNPGISKIKKEGGHVTVWTGATLLEFDTWEFVLGPKGLFFIYEDNGERNAHTVEGTVSQTGPTRFEIDRGDDFSATLETLVDGNDGDPQKIMAALANHEERLRTQSEYHTKMRPEFLNRAHEELGGELPENYQQTKGE